MKRFVGWKGLKKTEDNKDQNFLQKLKTTMMDDQNFKKLKKDNDDHNLIFFCSNEVPPAVSKRISLNVNCKKLLDIKQNHNIIFIYMVVLAFFKESQELFGFERGKE